MQTDRNITIISQQPFMLQSPYINIIFQYIKQLTTRCYTLRRAKNTPTRSFVSRTVNRQQMCNHFFQQKLKYLLRKCERTDKRTDRLTDRRTDKVIAIQPPLYEWGYNKTKSSKCVTHSQIVMCCTVLHKMYVST